MRKVLLIALLATSTVPIAAQAQQDQATATAGAAKSDLEKMVCEREEQIGSRLGARKVCKTVREWQEQRRVQRSDFEKVQQVVNQRPGG